MYKAIKEIGEYKIGDEVPADQAMVWLDMYAESHVELSEGESTVKVEVIEDEKSEESSNDILEDYLARSSNVVKKNVSRDNLNKDQLNELLKLEKSGKNRSAVIKAINKKLLL